MENKEKDLTEENDFRDFNFFYLGVVDILSYVKTKRIVKIQ